MSYTPLSDDDIEQPEDYETGQIKAELLEIERARATCDPNYEHE